MQVSDGERLCSIQGCEWRASQRTCSRECGGAGLPRTEFFSFLPAHGRIVFPGSSEVSCLALNQGKVTRVLSREKHVRTSAHFSVFAVPPAVIGQVGGFIGQKHFETLSKDVTDSFP